MKNLILTTFIFSILLSGCKNPFEAKDKGIDQLNAIEINWDDAHALASSTSRIALAAPVSELQNIRRDLEKLEVSECLIPAKEALISYMDSNIANFLKFMANDDSINFDSNTKIVEYFSIKTKCAGETNSNSNLAAQAAAIEAVAKAEAEEELAFEKRAKEKGLTAAELAVIEAEAAADAAAIEIASGAEAIL